MLFQRSYFARRNKKSTRWETFPPQGRVVVVAPHPDDAAIGCGGTIVKHVGQADEVTVIYLTDGQAGDPENKYKGSDYGALRREEARKGLEELGVSSAQFLGFMDGALRAQADLMEALCEQMRMLAPDILYYPSRWERFPDHRQAARAVRSAVKRRGVPLCCMEYEGHSHHRPNWFIDVTDVYEKKVRAIAVHHTQLAYRDYVALVKERNSYRAKMFGSPCQYSEAFFSWRLLGSQRAPAVSQEFERRAL